MMASQNKNYLTKERRDEIAAEVTKLKTEGRKAVAERLKQAKDLGDLSENSEYQEAREEQSRLEARINELEDILRNSAIFKKESGGGGVVRIGSVVKVKKGAHVTAYTIVGSNEAKPLQGFVSNESPIGKALLGKKAGDAVSVNAPSGIIKYDIVEVG